MRKSLHPNRKLSIKLETTPPLTLWEPVQPRAVASYGSVYFRDGRAFYVLRFTLLLDSGSLVLRCDMTVNDGGRCTMGWTPTWKLDGTPRRQTALATAHSRMAMGMPRKSSASAAARASRQAGLKKIGVLGCELHDFPDTHHLGARAGPRRRCRSHTQTHRQKERQRPRHLYISTPPHLHTSISLYPPIPPWRRVWPRDRLEIGI